MVKHKEDIFQSATPRRGVAIAALTADSNCCAQRSGVRGAILSLPALPNVARRLCDLPSRAIRSPKAALSNGGTMYPVTPSTTLCEISPHVDVETTGSPHAMASSTTIPYVSPNVGKTKTSLTP